MAVLTCVLYDSEVCFVFLGYFVRVTVGHGLARLRGAGTVVAEDNVRGAALHITTSDAYAMQQFFFSSLAKCNYLTERILLGSDVVCRKRHDVRV